MTANETKLKFWEFHRGKGVDEYFILFIYFDVFTFYSHSYQFVRLQLRGFQQKVSRPCYKALCIK